MWGYSNYGFNEAVFTEPYVTWNPKRTLSGGFPDGTSNTILFGEQYGDCGTNHHHLWAYYPPNSERDAAEMRPPVVALKFDRVCSPCGLRVGSLCGGPRGTWTARRVGPRGREESGQLAGLLTGAGSDWTGRRSPARTGRKCQPPGGDWRDQL